MTKIINDTYKQLREQFGILKSLSPNDDMLKYQEHIKRNTLSIYEYSEEYDKFVKTFDIPYGTLHRFVVKKCLNAIKTRINELQKPSKLENEVTAR